MCVCAFPVSGICSMTELSRWWGCNLSQALLNPYTMCARAHYLSPTTRHAIFRQYHTDLELDTIRIQHTGITNEGQTIGSQFQVHSIIDVVVDVIISLSSSMRFLVL